MKEEASSSAGSIEKLIEGALWVLAILWCCRLVYVFYPYLSDPYWIAGDEGQYIAQFYAWLMPERFAGDLSTQYTMSYTPFGFKCLFYLFSPHIDAMLVAKWGTVLLLVVYWGLCASIGYRLAGRRCALIAFLICSHCYIFPGSFLGFSPRVFSYPLVALFLLFWISRKRLWALVPIIMSPWVYPPAFLIMSGILCFDFLLSSEHRREMGRGRILTTAGVLIVCIAILLVFSQNVKINGPLVSYAEAEAMPEWHHFTSPQGPGRFDMIPFKPYFSVIFENIKSGLHTSPPRFYHGWVHAYRFIAANMHFGDVMFWVYVLVSFGIILTRYRQSTWLWSIFLTGVSLYTLARIMALHLYIPDRYLSYSLPLFTCMSLPLAYALLDSKQRWLRLIVMLIPFGVFFLYPTGFKLQRYPVTQDYLEVMAHLKKSQETIVLAGWPQDLDNVTLLSKQPFWANEETTHPFFKTTYHKQKQRIHDSLELMYGSDEKRLREILVNSTVTHLLLNKKVDLKSPPLFEPIRKEFLRRYEDDFKSSAPSSSYWASRYLALENDTYRLLDLRALRN